MTNELIDHVEKETLRFLDRLRACKDVNVKYGRGKYFSGTQTHGAARRAALDLKMELTKITKERYDRERFDS